MTKDKINKYVHQRWYSTKDMPGGRVKVICNNQYLYYCVIQFRKKGSKEIEGCYGSNVVENKAKSNIRVKNTIKTMLRHAQDNYGFNWKDFEVWNVNTNTWS